VVLWSFGDRVEASSVPLSPSLGRIQPWPGIKLVTRCFAASYLDPLLLYIYYLVRDLLP
jgi:hypothetical protein